MNDFLPVKRMFDRLANDKEDSDTAAFYCLLLTGEVVLKSVTLAIGACVCDRPNTSHYSIHHKLVRADGIGDWVTGLQEMLFGPAAQFVDDSMQTLTKQITQKVKAGEWQHDAVSYLHKILCDLGISADMMPPKVSLMDWFSKFVILRNKTRGHGAITGDQCAKAARNLEESILHVYKNIEVLKLPWARLKRNLSGKYKVAYLNGKSEDFESLKSHNEENLQDGLYLSINGFRRIELMHMNSDLQDIYFANGGFKTNTYEMLSYETNSTLQVPNDDYLHTVESLPESETQGLSNLDVIGDCFSNIPAIKHRYIQRSQLEEQLEKQVVLTDQHPIVSLTGPGGIGKTTLAITVLNKIMNNPGNPFSLIIWFSARDIDLLSAGPKQVKAHLLTKNEFSDEYVRLVEPNERKKKGFSSVDYLSGHLTNNPHGPTLYIFDNFETVHDQKAVYNWIDSFVRLPNKVLITTRSRMFKADYPLHVSGMSKPETKELITAIQESAKKSMAVPNDIIDEIYRDSDGHPYVVKILAGHYLTSSSYVKARKVIESQDELLTALFERTFDNLSPLSKKILMLLSNWYSMLPEVAIEAIQLRTADECLNVKSSLDELIQSSFVEEVVSDTDGQVYINVPYVAATFGKKKLKVSPMKAEIEHDTEFIKLFGPTSKADVNRGVFSKISSFISSIALKISDLSDLDKYLPTLELLARRVPDTWVMIARLVTEISNEQYELAKKYYLKYLEEPGYYFKPASVWEDLIGLSFSNKAYKDELHFLIEHSICMKDTLSVLSEDARKISHVLTIMRKDNIFIAPTEKTIYVKKMLDLLMPHSDRFDADDCSRVAWLYLAISDQTKAMEFAERGLDIDPANIYCNRLIEGTDKQLAAD